jgi:outer membrane protein assembly factor BamB
MTDRSNSVGQVICLALMGGVLSASLEGGQLPTPSSQVRAKEVFDASGVRGGLIVHLGCDGGGLTAALCAHDRYLVHGLDSDARDIEKAREHIKSQGLDARVWVERLPGEHLPYTDNLVNLLVVEDRESVSRAELMRVLAPGGTVCVKHGDGWTTHVKPRSDEIDDWTHYLHGPDNNAVAKDTRVGPPRHMQWKNGPMWCRSHEFSSSINCLVSAGGRIFVVQDEGIAGQPRGVPAQWHLVARDAFNGVLLWKRPISHGERLQRRVVAVGDRLYAPLGDGQSVSVLDGATGTILRTFPGTENAQEMVVVDHLAVIRMRDAKVAMRSKESGQSIAVFDGDSGKLNWKITVNSARQESLAACNGRVFYHDGKAVVALNLRDGKELWRGTCGSGRNLLIYKGVVVVSAGGGTQAFDAETGRRLWTGPSSGQDLFGATGLIWIDATHNPGRNVAWTTDPSQSIGLDPRTGKQLRKITVENLLSGGHHPRCYRARATERYLLQRKRGIEFIDLEGNDHMRHDWLRAACRHGFVPANGLLYAPPHQCFCYPGVLLSGLNVVSASVSAEAMRPVQPDDRLLRGSAWGSVEMAEVDAQGEDWPVYRHDAQRSGCASTRLPERIDRVWQAELGGTVTPPVVADGRIFVARKDAHTVCCLRADHGRPLWEFTANGPVDSPPTIYGPLVLFGSSDGHAYCLRASDGKLVWRFLAAPHRRRIMVFDRLESAWPVHGSVIVQDGLVYLTAGRSSYLDGGIYAYALDPQTGNIVHQNRIESDRPDVVNEPGRPFDMDGTRTDILVSDGEDLYMFHERLAPDLRRKEMPRTTRMGSYDVGLHLMCTDGFLDKTWFNRSFWTYSRTWPGFYFAFRASKSGQLLVFDEETVYAVRAYVKRVGHSPEYTIGSGYELYADSIANEPFLEPHAIGRDKTEGFTRSGVPDWLTRVPVRAMAMVVAGEQLVFAGPPDVAPENDPLAAFEGRLGARLWVTSTTDGSKLAEHEMESLPVFDGMIAAAGRLYIVTQDGRLICMGSK